MLLSHAHGDHIGDQKLKAVGAGSCGNAERVPAGPNSMTAEVAAAKNAAIVMTIDMGSFIGRKVQTLRGKPTGLCPQSGGVTTVPVAEACRSGTHLGGAFIASSELQDVGSALTLELRLPTSEQTFALPAVVRWARPGEGMGVQFVGVDIDVLLELNDYFATL